MIKKVIPEASKLVSELGLVHFLRESIEKAAMKGLKSETFYRNSWDTDTINTVDVVDYVAARKWDFRDLGYSISFTINEEGNVSGVNISW